MGDYWQYPDLRRRHKAMLLLGWRTDSLFTSEDEAMITNDLETALALDDAENLTPEAVDKLSETVYRVVAFQLMNVQERARMISGPYVKSNYLKPLLPLVDEAACCYYSGYFTAA